MYSTATCNIQYIKFTCIYSSWTCTHTDVRDTVHEQFRLASNIQAVQCKLISTHLTQGVTLTMHC